MSTNQTSQSLLSGDPLTMVHPMQLQHAVRRFYWLPQDDGTYWAGMIAKDGRIACWCPEYKKAVYSDAPKLCSHLEETVEFFDAMGWSRMRADSPWSNGEKIGLCKGDHLALRTRQAVLA